MFVSVMVYPLKKCVIAFLFWPRGVTDSYVPVVITDKVLKIQKLMNLISQAAFSA